MVPPDNISKKEFTFIPEITLQRFYQRLKTLEPLKTSRTGSVSTIITPMLIQIKLPEASIGELCYIKLSNREDVPCQVVGFTDDTVFITPFAPLHGVRPNALVYTHGQFLNVGVGPELLGSVLDCFGNPINGEELNLDLSYPHRPETINPMNRRRISTQLEVGVRAVDLMTPVGHGQRLGVFSTAGQGKSSLLGMLSRFSTADVNVIALIGERGREVLDFIEENLGEEGLSKSVVVVSTSDETPMRRVVAAYSATAIAEYFRDQGKEVLFIMDSITRFARALREIALSLGEPPARQGYPPSVFSAIPELLERAGNNKKGSITAFYSILLNSETMEDPLAEEVRAILDGHIYLSSRLTQMNHFPAIDVLRSNSRLQGSICDEEHLATSAHLRRLLAAYQENYDLISLGAYKKGSDPIIDEAIEKRSEIMSLLAQNYLEEASLESALSQAKSIVDTE